MIAGEAVENGDGGGVGEIVGAAGGEFGFERAKAMEVPDSVEEFTEGEFFGGNPGGEIGGKNGVRPEGERYSTGAI